MVNRDLKRRILEIAYAYKLAHLNSYLTSVDIIDYIYSKKNEDDIFILSSGHAALALYVVMEKYENEDAGILYLQNGGHPTYTKDNKIHCSTGSLGCGLLVAIGRALANKTRKVYVLISDGECDEGSVWEGLRIIRELKIENIEVHVNINGVSAYKEIDTGYLTDRLMSFLPSIELHYTDVMEFPFLKGYEGHYRNITHDEIKEIFH